ncbi:MAG: pilin [bacterium]|nr:pilin [bacterium]
MRSRIPLYALLLAAGSLVLPLSAHAGIPFFGPIIPAAYNVCAGGWGMLITVFNNLISLLITLVIVLVAPLMIAWAGFLFVVNPVNASGKEQAKKILMNTVVGIVIALAGWMIVDAIMAVLYNANTPAGTSGGVLGTWSSLIGSGGLAPCIPLAGSLNQTVAGTNITGVGATGTLNAPPSGKTGTACDPTVIQSAVPSLTPMQANILACIAQPESNCGAPHDPPNYNWNSAKSSPGSSAAGAFQVLLSTNGGCYENSACYAAAGVSGSLNCASGFSNGNPKTDSASAATVQRCVRAANNLNCSASAAACLLQKNGGSFSPWQADVNSATQSGCITSGG